MEPRWPASPASSFPASPTTSPSAAPERTFFEDADYKRYRTMLGDAARRAGAQVWAYCLMPNHTWITNYGDKLR